MSENKRAGTLYEQMFFCECLDRGLNISVPIGDYCQYDAIVDTGCKLIKIQVKGTASQRKDRSSSAYSITCGMGHRTSEKNRYKEGAYDILAALVIRGGCKYWYIIPKEKIGTNLSLKLFPNPTSRGKWEPYRHAWDLICKV